MQPYYCQLAQLPGLKAPEIERLTLYGIFSTKDLLKKTATVAAKQDLASQLKLRIENVNKWSILADLARIPSVNCRYCGLILHSGIASVSQLAVTPVGHLHQQIVRLSVATTRNQKFSPSLEIVKRWVEEARLLTSNT